MPAELDRCVNDLLNDKDFKPKQGKSKKDAAYAVCQANLNRDKQSITESGYVVVEENGKYVAKTAQVEESKETLVLGLEAKPRITKESQDFVGTEWRVRLIQAGVSQNGTEYSLDVLKDAVSIFEQVPVHAAIGPDHSEAERGVRSIVGFIKDVTAESDGLYGTFHVSDDNYKKILLDLHTEGVLNSIMGLSIVAYGKHKPGYSGNSKDVVEKLSGAESVDLVRNPAAGGKFIQVTESQEATSMTLEITEDKLKELMGEASAAGAKKALEEAQAILDEAEKIKAKPDDDEDDDDDDEDEKKKKKAKAKESETGPDAQVTEAQKKLTEAAQRFDNLMLTQAVSAAKLPDNASERITEAFSGKAYDETKVTAAIQAEKDYLASHEQKVVENLSNQHKLIVTRDEKDVLLARIDAIWHEGGKLKMEDGTQVKAFRGFKEAYCVWNNINPFEIEQSEVHRRFFRGLGGYDSEDKKAVESLYTESLQQSDLGEVVADRMHKALIRNYADFPQYQDWRKIARVLSVADYQAHRQLKFGGYGDLPVVAELGTYNDIAHPSDEETTVTLRKRGAIASQITRELILNDNVGAIAEIPHELALAAARTLYKEVFDILGSNETYGVDSTALFHADHSNLGTTALSITGVSAAFVAMRSQTRALATDNVLGEMNKPTILVVPNELEGLAERLVNPSDQVWTQLSADADADQDVRRFAGKMEVVVVDYFTNATDHFYVANPQMVAGIGVAFLNGNEEPELFVQGMDSSAEQPFNMDVQNVKIRHEYREVIMDYRPFYMQDVA